MASTIPDMQDFAATVLKACEDIHAMMGSYVNAATRSGTAAVKGAEDMTHNLTGLIEESYARGVSACKSMMSAKSPQEAADTHAEYLKDCFDTAVVGGSKLSELSLRAAKGAMDPLTQHANDAMGSIMKKAKAAV